MSAHEIKIKYHDPKLPKITPLINGDWVDLRAAESVVMKAGEYRLISLGVSMELPSKYEAHIVPRSSTFKNFGILQVNGMGIIDNSYSGEFDIWRFPALAMRDTEIRFGDRICQFRLVRNMGMVVMNEVDHLSLNGRGGFGSTGVE